MSSSSTPYSPAVRVLFVLAIGLTLVATGLSVSRLISTPFSQFFTGAATTSTTGTSSLTINANTAITNNVATINFGSGYTNASGCGDNLCKMDSNGQHNQSGRCCVGFTNITTGFLLENTGNLNISVNYTCTQNCTAADFIGGTGANMSIKVTTNSVAAQSGESGTTDTAASCSGYSERIFGGWNISVNPITTNNPENRYYEMASNSNRTLCGNTTHFPLDFSDSQDAAVVDINVSIPRDSPVSGKAMTLTFNAISSG